MENMAYIFRFLPKELFPAVKAEFDRVQKLSPEEILEEKCQRYNSQRGDLEGYDCPLCQNRGYFSKIVGNTIVDVECKCMVTRRNLQRIKNSGLTDTLLRCTFDTYIAKEEWQRYIKKKATEYINSPKEWFFIGGQVGCGKTHICTAITNHFLKNGISSIYIIWRETVTKLKSNIMNDEEYGKLINPLKTIDVLYIDDFFKVEQGTKPTSADINIAFELLNYRYNNSKLLTIISSEKTIEEIINLDEAVGSRIKEKAKGFSLSIDKDRNKNYRLKDIS